MKLLTKFLDALFMLIAQVVFYCYRTTIRSLQVFAFLFFGFMMHPTFTYADAGGDGASTASGALGDRVDVEDGGLSSTVNEKLSASVCTGEFVNPVDGMCWSCVMPIGISSVFFKGNQDGTKDLTGWKQYVCTCDLYIGVPISFYEPARLIDVTTKPYCMVGLGGISFGDTGSFEGDSFGFVGEEQENELKHVYQAHYYINPIMYILGQVMDNSKCFEQSGFDVAYMTEVDPSWLEPEYANMLSPDGFLYSSLPAVVACTGDCIAATKSFGFAEMHWCVGCNGLMYPMTGVIQDTSSTIDASGVIMLRLLNKLHRQGINLSYYGNNGLCGGYRQLLMNKRQYKYSMLFPVSQTKSVVKAMQTALSGTAGATGDTGTTSEGGGIGETVKDAIDFVSTNDKTKKQCCQPFGRSTFIWGSGRYYPIKGEDMSFQIYRKRDCCQKVYGYGD
ncbi:TraU family protein [Acinetobacter sp. P1(2025)]|uniref:TraU family protein n=1 Tax=Acinetobacter sp. P1(2025) TaxID=3446120 RepID=UPI003F5340CD